jgi:hypothetical protein
MTDAIFVCSNFVAMMMIMVVMMMIMVVQP